MSLVQLVVIGAGPGGYAAAFHAADLGMQVTLVDTEPNPGGVCLYRGCIPSKALLHVARLIGEARHASAWGMTYGDPKIDLDKLRAFKTGVVQKLTGGLGQLSKQRKITYIQGRASFVDAKTLRIDLASGGQDTLTFEHAIIATGSRPATVPGLSIDSPRVMDSTGALDLPDMPKIPAGRRRRLHRPRDGIGLRRARQQGHRRGDDAGAAAGRRSRPGHDSGPPDGAGAHARPARAHASSA